MKRRTLIQKIFDVTKFKTYLEIGCYKGRTFFPIRASTKIAVDPNYPKSFYLEFFKFIFKSPTSINAKYFKLTSDDFFNKKDTFLGKIGKLDVVFIDGLHTFKASLNDVLNSLRYLNINGAIIMHDCYPANEAAAYPSNDFPTEEQLNDISGWSGAWCGDVWKTIIYLRKKYDAYIEVCVIDTDNGLGIIKINEDFERRSLAVDEALFSEIDELVFNDMVQNANTLINLKPSNYAEDVVRSFKRV